MVCLSISLSSKESFLQEEKKILEEGKIDSGTWLQRVKLVIFLWNLVFKVKPNIWKCVICDIIYWCGCNPNKYLERKLKKKKTHWSLHRTPFPVWWPKAKSAKTEGVVNRRSFENANITSKW